MSLYILESLLSWMMSGLKCNLRGWNRDARSEWNGQGAGRGDSTDISPEGRRSV